MLTRLNGAPFSFNMQIRVVSLSENDVVLRVRAVLGQITPEGALKPVKGAISLDHVPETHYRPGEVLPVPIEGGGTVYLKGDVFDHQPKLAFGFPLEVPPGELLVRWPVLMRSHELLGDMTGASAICEKANGTVDFHARLNGVFRFARHPFPGAVQGEAEWGEIKFKLEGEPYRLIAAAPVTRGDQPVAVWVRRDAAEDSGMALGCGKLSE